MRKHFIDNIRLLIILCLFPFHTLFVYNGFNGGIDFFIKEPPIRLVDVILSTCSMWHMPMLFLLAGCSARFSLKKRSLGQYVGERFTKIALPFVAGVVLILPTLAFYGEKFHANFTGTLLDEYKLFFTGTGNTVFDTGFSLNGISHLWFLVFLFAISVVTFPFLAIFAKKGFDFFLGNAKPWCAPVLGGVIYIALDVFNPGIIDKNFIAMTFAFLLGFFCFSMDDVQAWLEKRCYVFLALAVGVFVLCWALMLWGAFTCATYSWLAQMAAIGLGVRFLNRTNNVCKYLQTASYGIYFFHMTWVVIFSYYLIKRGLSPVAHVLITLPISFIATVATYEIVRRIPLIRTAFALKAPHSKKTESRALPSI